MRVAMHSPISTFSAFAGRENPVHTSCMADADPIAIERGARLKRCRKGLGWTQDEMARETGWLPEDPSNGLSPSRIANFEQGTRRIGHEEAETFQKLFEIPSAYFMALIDKKEADILATLRGLKGRTQHLDPTG